MNADPSHDQMKRENAQLRKQLLDTHRSYVEVVNENLALLRELLRAKEALCPSSE